MATKKKDKKEDIHKKRLKAFTVATWDMITKELQDIEIDDLITGIFLCSEDVIIQDLIKRIEKQLLLCKIDNEKFKQTLNAFFLDTEKYIRKEKLYDKFFELAHVIYIEMSKKKVDIKILNAYSDMIIQQYAYFGGRADRNVYGVDEGNLMFMQEFINGYTEISYYAKDVYEGRMSISEYDKMIKKYGHKGGFKDFTENDVVYSNTEKITGCLLFSMAYFINKENEWLMPKREELRNPMDIPFVNPIYSYALKDFDKIKERLKNRNRLLPSSGINIITKNCYTIKEIYIKEIVKNGRLTLLFKIQFDNDTYTLGFYDVADKVEFTMWEGCSGRETVHKPLINLILQNYLYLTCKLTEEEQRYICFFKDGSKGAIKFGDIAPIMSYFVKKNNNDNEGTESDKTRNFDKENYNTEFKKMDFGTRKLPVGWKASDEAKIKASRYGIELLNGETFVSEFEKKVYKK